MKPTGDESRPQSFPGLSRRWACLVYEGLLLFGVLFTATYLYSSVTLQRHALIGKPGLQAFLFLVLGIYFTWFWSRSGQTVAMKAWHIRLVAQDGTPVSQARALARYLLSWIWFLPALAALYLSGLHSLVAIFGLLAAGVMAYAALSRLHPQRQFLHDAVCGTRLVTHHPRRPA